MKSETPTQSFRIQPQGVYSLEASAQFIGAWHPAPADGQATGGHLHLAFCDDQDWEPVGVCLTQSADGAVQGEIRGRAPADSVRDQVARILSLDVDGRGWPEVGERDPVLAGLQRRSPG